MDEGDHFVDKLAAIPPSHIRLKVLRGRMVLSQVTPYIDRIHLDLSMYSYALRWISTFFGYEKIM
jgi:hypothetical protein